MKIQKLNKLLSPSLLSCRIRSKVSVRSVGRRRSQRAIWASSQSASVKDKTVAGKKIRLTPVRSLDYRDPSGQEASGLHGAPLCGSPTLLGAHYDASAGGVNFAIFSSGASKVWLVLLTEEDLASGNITEEIELDPICNKTGDIWHIALPKIKKSNLLYGYRMDGKHQDKDEEDAGYRYDKGDILIDPYATNVISRKEFGKLGPDLDYSKAFGLSRTWSLAASCVPSKQSGFDWQGDKPLGLPLEDLVIYEMHVRGFTKDPSSNVSSPGTYKGLTERLDYLQDLGVNCIELLPVHEFNELEYYQLIPGTEDSYRFNVWGYSTVNFFSPMSRYSQAVMDGGSGLGLLDEFKTMVRECHKRGMEVIMDVVFNHTAEGNHKGPSLSFRGIDNRVYYMLAPGGEYYNYSGCGNTFNCNHPVVRRFIVDALRYWVLEMHVDGFRFDLASILTRAHSTWHTGEMTPEGIRLAVHGDGVVDDRGHMESGGGQPIGTPLTDPAVVAMISEDPVLRNTKLIAEAWDCDGLNQVGAFPHYGGRWAEWNGTFRDVVRAFIKGTDGPWAGDFAAAICGSPNIYAVDDDDSTNWWKNNGGKRWAGNRGPMHSVNFVTAHDGFSLADLVSFNEKHNEANGENNEDGEKHNSSWNSGVEGVTADMGIKALRRRQMKNFFCALLLSHGVPMMLMGDEYGHTKGGNNNTYCHDDALNWLDWGKAAEQESTLVRFVKHLTNFRMSRKEFRRTKHVMGDEITWHGDVPDEPDWSETSRFVAFSAKNEDGGSVYVAFNSSHLSRSVELPELVGQRWDLVVDTGMDSPYDVLIPDKYLDEGSLSTAKKLKGSWISKGIYPMMSYSCIVLVSVPAEEVESEESLF